MYTQEYKFVVSIMTWMVTVLPQEPVVLDSAAQTSTGKLLSAGPQISILYSIFLWSWGLKWMDLSWFHFASTAVVSYWY
jgi:hypothetical protein